MTSDAATKLTAQMMEKPWGRTELPEILGTADRRRIGEIWFTPNWKPPLLAKYLFTSEALSIQNHPDDEHARSIGLPGGKEECWYILEVEPGALLGLGPIRSVSKAELREAALDGTIVDLLDWRPVKAGDFYFVPAGTVHAIGAGISLIEFQQNHDITYRLYDYGRPRELQLEEAIAVARTDRYADPRSRHVDPTRSSILVEGPPFSLDHVVAGDVSERLQDRRRWVLPIEGAAHCGAIRAVVGECLLIEPGAEIVVETGRALIGAEAFAIK